MDAWNARFVEGKKRFDDWEQQNEIGRTVLAGLRTVWLVDEQARRRVYEKKSRYRAIQSLYDGKYWLIRKVRDGRVWFRTQFRSGDGTIHRFIEGVKWDLTNNNQDSMYTRLGAAIAAVIAVNIGGAIFSISPTFSNILAVMVAMVWPTWASDVLSLLQDIGEEFQEKGKQPKQRGAEVGARVRLARGNIRLSPRGGAKSSSLARSSSTTFDVRKIFGGGYDKSRYHFYVRSDGKTKRLYRTGQSSSFKNLKSSPNAGKTTTYSSWIDSFLPSNSYSKATRTKQTRAVSTGGFWNGLFGTTTNMKDVKRW
jgi:hypothetical protein